MNIGREIRKWGRYFLLAFFILSSGTCRPAESTLVLLFSNDTHGIFQPRKIREGDRIRLVGGMEAASHYVTQIRSQEENVLLIDTGDVMTGTIATTLPYRGVTGGAMPEFLNLLGYDIRCYGNHAFDLGQDNVRAIESLCDMPTIMANIVYQDTGELFAPQPYAILTSGDLRIGVIAVMEEFFLLEVSPEKVQGLAIEPIVPTLERWLPEIRNQSDLVVVLLHSKYFDAPRVARSVPGIDVILVASEDGRFETINGVLIKSTLGHQRTLGYLKLQLRGKKIAAHEEKLIWLWADEDLQPDSRITSLVAEIEASIEQEYRKIVGESGFDYKSPGYSSIENSLGNWITDVMRWKAGTDIGLLNSGGIRADIFSGPITVRTLYEVSPFFNILVMFQISGRELKQILETDIERGRDRLQISGMRYTYHPRGTRPVGQRVDFLAVGDHIVFRDGELIKPDQLYSVVSNDYVVAQARKKYFGFPVEKQRETEITLTDAMIEWLQKNRVLVCSIEERIVEIKSEHTR